MVSKTLQSLDAWLARQKEVLAQQSAYSDAKPEPFIPPTHEPVQLTLLMLRITSDGFLRGRLSVAMKKSPVMAS